MFSTKIENYLKMHSLFSHFFKSFFRLTYRCTKRNPESSSSSKLPAPAFRIFYLRILEFCVMRCTRERNNITDVCHTCYEQQQTFKAQSETGMRT